MSDLNRQVEPDTPEEPRSELAEPTVIAHNFESISELEQAGGSPPDVAASPLVVVHYRSRLGIGLILLSLVLGAETAYLVTRPTSTETTRAERASGLSPGGRQTPGTTVPTADSKPPLVLEVRSLPVDAVDAEAAPAAGEALAAEVDPDSSLVQPDLAANVPEAHPREPVAVGFDRPGTAPPPLLAAGADAAQPGNGPVPLVPRVDETKQAFADIQQEAILKRAERQELLDARGQQAEVERKRAALAAHAQRQQQPLEVSADLAKRESFRVELQQVVQRGGAGLGEQVMALVKRHGGDPNLSLAQNAKGRSRSYSTDRARRIALLRSQGISEPAILGDLIALEIQALATRQGSRSYELSIVRAARQLLAIPPSATSLATALPPAPPPERGPGRFP